MKEIEFKNLATCIEKGTNPVEVAGYGRESTHKGYLTWLLNSEHWNDARKAIDLLIDWPSPNARKITILIRNLLDSGSRIFRQNFGVVLNIQLEIDAE